MASSLGKVTPFIVVNKSASLYGTSGYPLGGTNPPPSSTVSAPGAPNTTDLGPLPGTNCINLLTLRDYYKIPYPPTTPLASPPVIGIVSFGGGIYGQPVSSGKYSGFWRCTDISGANGAPIQILVSPINGAINAPNADDGGATLENTVDVATVSAFYGMINQGRDAPVYTPPVIILYIAPSDNISEMYNTFYTVLNNPVVCNGQSYTPSVVCCSWGAPETSWTQKNAVAPSDAGLDVNDDPNPAGIAQMNEINDLFAAATKRGINICVASGDIPLPSNGSPSGQFQSDLADPTIMFPASSPYVTCVGGSSVFFPNGPKRNYANPGEFAWARANGGVSTAFPIPDYQTDIAGSALISANAFLTSSNNTTELLQTALGAANVTQDNHGDTENVSRAAAAKLAAFKNSTDAFNSATAALAAANAAANGDSSSLQLQLALNVANTAYVAAKANNDAAQAALAAAQDAVVKAARLDSLLIEASSAWKIYDVQIATDSDNQEETLLDETARDAALLVANNAVAQGASSVFAPFLGKKYNVTSADADGTLDAMNGFDEDMSDLVANTALVSKDLVVPYESFVPAATNPLTPPPSLKNLYTASNGNYPAKDNLLSLQADINTIQDDVRMDSESDNVYDYSKAIQQLALKSGANAQVVGLATQAARLVNTLNNNVSAVVNAKAAWTAASAKQANAQEELTKVLVAVPASDALVVANARDVLSAANQALSDASVVLADAEYAALVKVNDSASVSDSLVTACFDANAGAYVSGFNSANTTAMTALRAAQNDASGANVDILAAQINMGYTVSGSLEGLAQAAKYMAQEMVDRHDEWSETSGVQYSITAADKAIASAHRVVNVMTALKALYNNAAINEALNSEEVWSTTGSDASGSYTVNVALTAAETALDTMYGALVDASSNALDAPSDTNIDIAYNAVSNALYRVQQALTSEKINVTSATALPANVTIALENTLNTEGAILYATSEFSNGGLSVNEADNAAAISAADAIYDQFTALNIAVTKAKNLANYTIKRANLANARLRYSDAPVAAVNKTIFDAQDYTYKLVAAAMEIKALVQSYSSVTPSLIDSAVRSQVAIMSAAEAANTATAARNPAPVTPQMLDALQKLVLKAKAEAKLLCEAQPTSAGLLTILTNWNTAVLKGAAALDAIDETLTSSPTTVTDILNAFSSAIAEAANNGTYYEPDAPTTSDLSLAAKAAYDFSSSYFADGINRGNLKYLMNVANAAIHAAEHASEVANAAETNAPRVSAQTNWNDAASRIEAIVGVSTGFNFDSIALPSELYTSVAVAYKKTTGRNVSGSVRGKIIGTTLTVDSITGTLAIGSVLTYFAEGASRTATVSALLSTSPTGLTGTYTLSGLPTAAPVNTIFGTETVSQGTASDDVSTSEPYITAVAAFDAFRLAYDNYNKNFYEFLINASNTSMLAKTAANTAIALALSAAARTQVATKISAQRATMMATGSASYQDDAALNATEAAYAAADNVNMYRCVPDIAMHANADDLPIIYRLNGGNVYVGGTSVAVAMFAGFLGVTQSHGSINYFLNPVLYNNFSYPSPLFYDISGTTELLNHEIVTDRYNWVIYDELSDIHGSYNSRVGLGSVRADALSAFLETPKMVTDMRCGPYPVDEDFDYLMLPAGIQSYTVRPGTTQDLYVFVRPTSSYNTNVAWSCSSPYNATITQTLETYQNVDVGDGTYATVYKARVTGVVPVDPLAPAPVITVSSTDGSNVFTTINVNVLPAVQVVGVSISALNETKNPSNTVLYLGKTLQLIATVTPVTATNKAVYWWSSNTSIVNVDPNGLITPLAPGQATIRVTTVNNNISASINVYVPTPMTGISVTPSMVTLNPSLLVYPLKNTQLIKALVTPNNVDYKYVQWKIVSSQPQQLPPGTTDSNGNVMLYKDNHADASGVIVASIHQPNGTVLKRDSNGVIIDNTQDTVTAVSNGRVVIRVSTDGVADTVYGTYNADMIVNVVTPITNVTLQQTNMVIALNPSTAVPTGPMGVYADASGINPMMSTFKAVNPSVNVQYSPFDPNTTLPWINAEVADRNLPQSYPVTATMFPAYPSNMNLFWSSSNPKVAIVSNNTPAVLNVNGGDPNNGLFQVTESITPLSNGSTVITVTTADGNKVASVNVLVTTPVTNIVLSPMPVTLTPGKQYALQATVLPTTATITDLTWSSTNVAVARVDQNGVVTAVSTGSCGISVSTADGDYTAMATINVVTPLVGVSLVLNTPTPIRIGDVVQILVVMTPTTASDQAFTWSVTNGVNGNIFTNGPAQNGNIVYLDAAQSGTSVFTVTTHDGNKQASLSLTVAPY